MPRDLHPTDGARYLLELDAELPTGARYRATIYTPSTEHHATATLDFDGTATLTPSGAPDALHARLLSISRLVARDAATLRDDNFPPWPARILRWRR